ncbi:MAG TPA: dTMP kinase [Polyangiaceae bacterium]|nr:dTMP kinase [Polyangiaceae bacterium]
MSSPAEICRRAAGLFIVLEGIDGAGTTTQAQVLAATFERHGHAARFTHEPSALPVGRLLRQLLGAGSSASRPDWDGMALLFAADRLEHVAREISPLLESKITVVCDRYDLSTLAYQSATAGDEQAALPWLRAINQRARRPDVTLVLDVDAGVAEARRALRGGEPELFERRELQRRLADIYAEAEQLVPGDLVLHIDANGTLAEVEAGVIAALGRALPQL